MKCYYNLTQDEQDRVKRLVDQEVHCMASWRMIEENSDELCVSDFFESGRRDEEIINYWFVSSWLQSKLEECQEYTTDSFLDMNLWGNTSGGALYTHPAIIAICFDEIDEYIEEENEEDEEDEVEYQPSWTLEQLVQKDQEELKKLREEEEREQAEREQAEREQEIRELETWLEKQGLTSLILKAELGILKDE